MASIDWLMSTYFRAQFFGVFCVNAKTLNLNVSLSLQFEASLCYFWSFNLIATKEPFFSDCISGDVSAHMDFNTGLFRRTTKSWSTHQLNSTHTEASQRLTQQHDRVTYFCGCHDRGVIQKILIYKYKKPTLAYDTINKISGILENIFSSMSTIWYEFVSFVQSGHLWIR